MPRQDSEFARHGPGTVGNIEQVARIRVLRYQAQCLLFRYSVGKLLYDARFAHLDGEELRDFRVQFGDTWQLVQTMLGHRSVTTTMDVCRQRSRFGIWMSNCCSRTGDGCPGG
jgi:alpha-ketoglutarate-dependent taurine dioxygenase